MTFGVARPGLLALGVAAATALAGCSTVPSAGPTARQITRSLTRDNQTGFTIVDIDPAVTAGLAPAVAGTEPLAALAAPGRTDTLGPGDVLSVDIYEVGVTLFAKGSATGTAGNNSFTPAAGGTTVSAIVNAEGAISLPYVGRITVAGRTPGEVERQIEQGMAGLSQRPQAVVSVRQNAHNVFFVSGDVRAPGRFDLGLPRQRLLDALARAGGTTNQPDDMIVRLTRNGRSAETRLSAIESAGPQDVELLPGDRVELFNRPRTYLVFGASDRVSQVAFGSSALSMAEALARVAGPSERIADPSAVFLFRWAPPATPGAEPRPVIYRLNMMRADSYFLSQRIGMQDKDVIYIASAAANAPLKVTQIIGQLFSPALLVRSVTQ